MEFIVKVSPVGYVDPGNEYIYPQNNYRRLIQVFRTVRDIQECTLINQADQQHAQQMLYQPQPLHTHDPFGSLFNHFGPSNNSFRYYSASLGPNGQLRYSTNSSHNAEQMDVFSGLGGLGGFGELNSLGTLPSDSTIFDSFFQELANILQMPLQEDVTVALTDEALDKLAPLNKNQLQEKVGIVPEDRDCHICLNMYKDDDENQKYMLLPCEHYFHYDCLHPYLKDYSYKCPICKEECGSHAPK